MTDIHAAHRERTAVRKAREEELRSLAAVLARAFYDDPQLRFVLPDDETRLQMSERGFELYLRRLWFPHDETHTTPSHAGVSVWELPGQWKVSVWRQLTLLPSMTRIYGRHFPRLMRAITALESNHPDEHHYYLPFIGVDDGWRGRGIGSALLSPILEQCDTVGTPAYLEASKPENVPLYERHGFKVTEQFTIGKGGPPIYRMWRSPAPS